jgi:hypothetical protein
LLVRNGDADAVLSSIQPNLPAAISFVTCQAARTPFGTTAACPLDCAAFHQGFEGDSLMSVSRCQGQGHEFTTAFGTQVDVGAEASPLDDGLRLRRRRPFFAPAAC